MRRALLVKTAVFAGIVLALSLGALFMWARATGLAEALRAKEKEAAALDAEKTKLNAALSDKDKALEAAAKQNFQEQFVSVQAALKDANQKLGDAIRAKANAENTSVNLDSRLKNTTNEFTKTLEELKKSREALAGIDGQYKVKFAQAAESLKVKEDQVAKLSQKIKEKEAALASVQNQGKDFSEAARKYERQAAELRASVASLTKALTDKEKLLGQKEEQLRLARPSGAKSARVSGRAIESTGVASALEAEKARLERQVSDASARIFDQREQLKDMEKRLDEAMNEASGRERALASKEYELERYRKEVDAMKKDIRALKAGSSDISASAAVFSAEEEELEARIRDLERDKAELETQLRRAEARSPVTEEGALLDGPFKILTEALAVKEEEAKSMQDQLDTLLREKKAWVYGAGDKQQRLAELELLVATLTRQLGDYAALIQKKDAELKISAQKIAELSDEIGAQKAAAASFQKELIDARARQEKTFQSLTQIMGMNSGLTPSPLAPEVADAPAAGQSAPIDDADVKKNVDELRRKVEVMLKSK